MDFENSHENQMLWLKNQGFDIVEYEMVTAETLETSVKGFAEKIESIGNKISQNKRRR